MDSRSGLIDRIPPSPPLTSFAELAFEWALLFSLSVQGLRGAAVDGQNYFIHHFKSNKIFLRNLS